jgi:hypothetical protein
VADCNYAEFVLSPIVVNGTSGCVFFKASVMPFEAMSNMSGDDICDIGELLGKNSKVSTIISLAVDEM